MDGDPAVEPEIDAFSLILPLPYRVAIILVTGMVSSRRLLERLADRTPRCVGLGRQSALSKLGQDRTLQGKRYQG